MSKRHGKLGVKQTIQKHWMDMVLRMLLAGQTEGEIRAELGVYLATQKQSGGVGERGQTYRMAIALLAAWFAPDKELLVFRDEALHLAKEMPQDDWLPLHWAVLSAAYPFWFQVAKVCGRLLGLQKMVLQRQIFERLREQYGDRESMIRNARHTVRSFIAWGVLEETSVAGRYSCAEPVPIIDGRVASLLLESALLALPEGKAELAQLLQHPSFFPFQLSAMTVGAIRRNNARIDATRHGLDGEMLMLRK